MCSLVVVWCSLFCLLGAVGIESMENLRESTIKIK